MSEIGLVLSSDNWETSNEQLLNQVAREEEEVMVEVAHLGEKFWVYVNSEDFCRLIKLRIKLYH